MFEDSAHSAYPEYERIEWVRPPASFQEAAPIYRPQPQYGYWQRTLSPQPLQPPDYRPKGAPPILAQTPANRAHTVGPIGPRNSELDMGRVQPSAPAPIVPGSNAALRSHAAIYPRALFGIRY